MKMGFNFVIIQFCTVITLIFFPLYLFESFIQSCPFWSQPFLILIFGIGGIGLYVIVGYKIRSIELKIERGKE